MKRVALAATFLWVLSCSQMPQVTGFTQHFPVSVPYPTLAKLREAQTQSPAVTDKGISPPLHPHLLLFALSPLVEALEPR